MLRAVGRPSFATRFAELRKAKNLSQAECGKRLGVSQATIANLEAGRLASPKTKDFFERLERMNANRRRTQGGPAKVGRLRDKHKKKPQKFGLESFVEASRYGEDGPDYFVVGEISIRDVLGRKDVAYVLSRPAEGNGEEWLATDGRTLPLDGAVSNALLDLFVLVFYAEDPG